MRRICLGAFFTGLAFALSLAATREELETQKKRHEILDYYLVRIGSVGCVFRIGFLIPTEVVWESHIRSLGKTVEVILEKGGFQLRKYVRENPGDWVACSLDLEHGDTVRLWQAEFGFVYGDTVIWALEYVSTESMFEFEIYTPDDLLQVPGSIRPRSWGGFGIWLRFPVGTFAKTGTLSTRGYAFLPPDSVVIVNHWKGQ